MSNSNTISKMKNTNRWETRTIVSLALLAAIGGALSFIELPFIAIGFLMYDASNVPALIAGLMFGPGPGLIVGSISALIHGLFSGNWPGCLMNICAVAAHVLPAAILYKKKGTIKGAIVGLIIGALFATAVMAGMNIVIDPVFYGYTTQTIIALILPVFVPFNIIKTLINSVLCILIYKPIQNQMHPTVKPIQNQIHPTVTSDKAVASDDEETNVSEAQEKDSK